MGSDDKKSLLVTLGLPEDVAAAAVATDSSKGYRASKTRTALFYTLKVNADAKAEWKQHFATYTAEAKASKGHVNVSHSYNEATKEVICIDVLAGRDAMSNHIGNCFPAYASTTYTPRSRLIFIAVFSPLTCWNGCSPSRSHVSSPSYELRAT